LLRCAALAAAIEIGVTHFAPIEMTSLGKAAYRYNSNHPKIKFAD
jgi:hypothetical protein